MAPVCPSFAGDLERTGLANGPRGFARGLRHGPDACEPASVPGRSQCRLSADRRLWASLADSARRLRTLQHSRVRLWAAFGALGAGGVAQALVALWERAEERNAPDAPGLRRSAEQAVHRFFKLSKRSPVCWPYALLLRGRAARLAGVRPAARRDWLAAANAASRLGMPHVLGLACFELGEHGSRNHSERLDRLRSAERIFASHGAENDLARLRHSAPDLKEELRP